MNVFFINVLGVLSVLLFVIFSVMFTWFCFLVQALIEEYSPELTSKVGKLDSDPHLWMPVRNADATAIFFGSQQIEHETGTGRCPAVGPLCYLEMCWFPPLKCTKKNITASDAGRGK